MVIYYIAFAEESLADPQSLAPILEMQDQQCRAKYFRAVDLVSGCISRHRGDECGLKQPSVNRTYIMNANICHSVGTGSIPGTDG